MSHTYVILTLSALAFEEIREKLAAAGYQHAFHDEPHGIVIDMHGIAVQQVSMSDKLEARLLAFTYHAPSSPVQDAMKGVRLVMMDMVRLLDDGILSRASHRASWVATNPSRPTRGPI